jgi:hypothetical protein
LQQIRNFVFEEFSEGCPSSVESDSLEDGEEDGSMKGGDLEEMLRWPPELWLALHHGRRVN